MVSSGDLYVRKCDQRNLLWQELDVRNDGLEHSEAFVSAQILFLNSMCNLFLRSSAAAIPEHCRLRSFEA